MGTLQSKPQINMKLSLSCIAGGLIGAQLAKYTSGENELICVFSNHTQMKPPATLRLLPRSEININFNNLFSPGRGSCQYLLCVSISIFNIFDE